ncbi:ABC transporter ATP-binding protein [Criblamydia sequanensis]|uniref:ABC-type transporter, ATPase subunit n=1 Tax=Candidatus Criblamydia sequanensis CRIB-18 TaxID=1437425 RepID=A0A090DXN1_9BACT|nr:ABC transporter ATP-binding protein [Criblamydia sequanensis]CDR33564.1 ABC-type transporter, ATPase subunit [Criblamydia sequanensis CRIB-18]
MLSIKNISCSLGNRLLLRNIDLNFQPGFIYSVLGPNGSGKTTLLKAIAGIQVFYSGSIFWNSQEISFIKRRERSQIMTFVPQSSPVFFDFTVKEFALMGAYAKAIKNEEQKLEESLNKVDALHLKDRLVRTLSSGEKQRVYIARSLIADAPVMLFDEPTASLDIKHRHEIWQLIHDLKELKKIIIVATHDFHEAEKWSDESLVLQKGSVVSKGAFSEALSKKILEDVFGVDKLILSK